MENFTPDEQFLISKLKLLKVQAPNFGARQMSDIDEHVRGELKVRIFREIAAFQPSPRILLRSPRFAFASIATTFLVVSMVTVVSFAKQSLPNDALYPVKVALEDMQMFFVRDPIRKAALHAKFASERLKEAQAIAKANGDPQRLQTALSRYEASVGKVKEAVSVIEKRPVARKEVEEEVGAIAKQLSDTAALLLKEAERQLAEDSHSGSAEVSKKFVEAAQTSVAVLSEVVERLEGEPVDKNPVSQ
jgi:hypothetical protein